MVIREWSTFIRRSVLAATIAISTAIGATACSKDTSTENTEEPSRNVLARSLGGQPGSLDPQFAEDAFSYDVLRDL